MMIYAFSSKLQKRADSHAHYFLHYLSLLDGKNSSDAILEY